MGKRISRIRRAEAQLCDNNKVKVSWVHNTRYTCSYDIEVIKNDGDDKTITTSTSKEHYIECDPAAKYDFVVSFKHGTPIQTKTIHTAPSKIVNLKHEIKETSVLVLWEPLRNEKVYYSIVVSCKDQKIAEVSKKEDCSYELDVKNLLSDSDSYEFKVWAVSEMGGVKGSEAVHKLKIDVTDVKAVLENNKAIVTWKYLLKKKFIVQVKEDGHNLDEKVVSERKFVWPCCPSHKYDFNIRVEDAPDSDAVFSNSVCSAPSRVSRFNVEEKERSLLISWTKEKNESVSYNIDVLCDSEIVFQKKMEKNCSFELILNQKIRQADNCMVKVWAVSNQGGTMSEPVIYELSTGVFDLEAKIENDKAILTWKSFLRNKFEYKVIKNDQKSKDVHTVSQKQIEWPCEPACKYEFLVRGTGKIDTEARSDSIYTAPMKPGHLIVEETCDGLLASWQKSSNKNVSYKVKVYRDADLIAEASINDCSYVVAQEHLKLSSQYRIEVSSFFLEKILSAEPAIGIWQKVPEDRMRKTSYCGEPSVTKMSLTYVLLQRYETIMVLAGIDGNSAMMEDSKNSKLQKGFATCGDAQHTVIFLGKKLELKLCGRDFEVKPVDGYNIDPTTITNKTLITKTFTLILKTEHSRTAGLTCMLAQEGEVNDQIHVTPSLDSLTPSPGSVTANVNANLAVFGGAVDKASARENSLTVGGSHVTISPNSSEKKQETEQNSI